MRPGDNDLSGPAPRPASRVCARLASGEEAWARRLPRAAEPRAGGAARGTRFPCASPCVPASSPRSRVPWAGRGRRLSPPWPPARTCPRRPLAVPVPWGCRLWSSATPTWTARISGSACSVTRLSWSEPTSSSKSSLRTALCSSGRWGVSSPGGEWVERARGSGESPRGVGLRGGLEEEKLLLFEWVWGQKLKSSPAGDQQNLFVGVLDLFTPKSTEKGKVSLY